MMLSGSESASKMMARKMSSRVGEDMEKDSTLRRSFSFSRIPKRAV